jgi:hypothetical protein
MYNSPNATTCAATTTAKAGTPEQAWQNGHYFDDVNPDTTTITLNAQTTEIEVCIKATSNLEPNKTYYFRVTDAGTAFSAYTKYAELDSWVSAVLSWQDYGAVLQYDPAKFDPAPAILFEAFIKYGGGPNAAYARLFNVTDNQPVAGSEVSTTSSNYERKRSGPLSLPNVAKEYKAQVGAYTNETAYIKGARLILQQG